MNISVSEIMVVLLIALLVIKPAQLPEIAKTLGRFIFSIKRLMEKIKNEMNDFIDPADKKHNESRKREPL